MSEIKRGFQTPPEVLRYFSDKNLKPAFSWQDVFGQEHAYAFTVAKAVELELLALLKNSIQDALAKGQGFETWRAALLPELQRLGWVGKRTVVDPTGKWKSKEVDFSSPRRLQTIFWSNVTTARAAGQWERAQRTKAGLPYLLYVRTTSAAPRKEHLAWAGLVLPVDDPFWNSHFPPNGWRCKCAVRQISKFEAGKMRDDSAYSFEAPEIETKDFLNRRTGEVAKIPVGIDPGWQTNPGKDRAKTLLQNLQTRLDAAGPKTAREKIAEIMDSPMPEILMNIDERLHLPATSF